MYENNFCITYCAYTLNVFNLFVEDKYHVDILQNSRKCDGLWTTLFQIFQYQTVIFTRQIGSYHHSMALSQVVDGAMASRYEV